MWCILHLFGCCPLLSPVTITLIDGDFQDSLLIGWCRDVELRFGSTVLRGWIYHHFNTGCCWLSLLSQKNAMNIIFVSSDSFPSQTTIISISPEHEQIISKESLLKSYDHFVTQLCSLALLCSVIYNIYALSNYLFICIYCFFLILNILSFLIKWVKVVKKSKLCEKPVRSKQNQKWCLV